MYIAVRSQPPQLLYLARLWPPINDLNGTPSCFTKRNVRVSVGSDFHRDSPYGAGLGVSITEMPEGMGVWETL